MLNHRQDKRKVDQETNINWPKFLLKSSSTVYEAVVKVIANCFFSEAYDKKKQDWQDCQSLARAKILIGKPVKT